MIVANIRSNADLQAKKDLQKQLLELEVANEAVREQRQKDSGNKEIEAKKLPEYKTSAEVLKDKVSLEKKALDSILELGFNYTDAGQLVNWISSQNRLADFTTGFKGIKKDLTEEYDKSVLTPEFVKNYLDNYFIDLDANLGKRFSREIGFDTSKGGVKGLEDLMKDLPTKEQIDELKDLIITSAIYHPKLKEYSDLVVGGLNTYGVIIPDEALASSLINLTQNERIKLIRRYRGLLDKSQYISASEMNEIIYAIKSADDENTILPILKRIARQLSFLSPQTVSYFVKMQEDLIKTTIDDPVSNYEQLQKDLEIKKSQLLSSEQYKDKLKRAEEREVFRLTPKPPTQLNYDDVKDFVREQQRELQNQITALEYAKIVRDENFHQLTRKERQYLFPKGIGRTFSEISEIRFTGLIRRNPEELADLFFSTPEKREDYKVIVPHKKATKKQNKSRTLRNREGVAIPVLQPTEPIPERLKIGQEMTTEELLGEISSLLDKPEKETGKGLLSKLKKHFKGDEKLLKKVAKALQEDSSSDSSSDEEEMREVNRHIKATDKIDKMIEKKVGKGEFLPKAQRDAIYSGLNTGLKKIGLGGSTDVPFKATRIPTSKVGKGVKLEKEENPTYRQFGKYVIHIPHLLHNNTANFKYPSLGSIPTIKPLTISTDYKDLLLDVLQSGKLNKKELERLPQNEIKHFERVAVGAGLVEQLGMKIGNTDEDKADAKRFEILRGEYLAGNNNEKMIKELRQLITKFINSGRLHKTEGFNLLLELSTL